MMKKFILFGVFLVLFITPSYAYWGNTHERITERAVLEMGSLLNDKITKIRLQLREFEKSFGLKDVRYILPNAGITEDDGIRFGIISTIHSMDPGLLTSFIGSSSYEWADTDNSGWSWGC